MSKWSGNKVMAVLIISFVAIALLAGAAVAAVGYLNDDHHHHDGGEHGACHSGGEDGNLSEECHESGECPYGEQYHEDGDCPLEEQCEKEGDGRSEGLDREEDHDCFEEHQRRGGGDSQTGNGHGCRR